MKTLLAALVAVSLAVAAPPTDPLNHAGPAPAPPAANPYQYTPKLARDASQLMYGTMVWTTTRKDGNFRTVTTHTVKGSFIRYRNSLPCHDMPPDALDDKTITFRSYQGTLTAEETFEDNNDYSGSSKEDLAQITKWKSKSTILPVQLSPADAAQSLYFFQYGPNERVSLGCVTMNPETGRFWVTPPWVNNMNGWVSAPHVATRHLNQLGSSLPYGPENQGGYDFQHPDAFTEGRFDPKLDRYSGSWSVIDPPQPGPDEAYVEHKLVWTLSYKEEGDIYVEGPKCACKPDETLSYKGVTTLTGGKFEKFEVKSDGAMPQILANEGGAKPKLELKGDAKSSGKTKITAVYRDAKGNLQKSKAFEVNFCELEGKPELAPNPTYLPTSDKEAYVYDKSSRGRLEIQAHARKVKLWSSGQEQDLTNLVWEIKPAAARQFSPKANDTAKEVNFISESLPLNNSDFGKKQITLTTAPDACDCTLTSEPEKVKVFYPINISGNDYDGNLITNPGGKEPNWLYYYKQTPAWTGISNSSWDVTIPKAGWLTEVDPDETCRYDFWTDVLYISNAVIFKGALAPPDEPGDRAFIDALATCLRHEGQHRVDFLKWWGLKMERYPKAASYVGWINVLDPLSPDCDHDWVPNDFEHIEKCNDGCAPMSSLKASQHSCPSVPAHLRSKLRDHELHAYNTGWNTWKRGQANQYDWGYPGNQCDGVDCHPPK